MVILKALFIPLVVLAEDLLLVVAILQDSTHHAPNISGTTKVLCNGYPEGAFYTISGSCGGFVAGGSNFTGFNASRSNIIYSHSNTVQPASCQALMIIKL